MKKTLSFIAIGTAVTIFACNAPTKQPTTDAAPTQATATDSGKTAATAATPTTKWEYTADLNKMTSDSNHYASIVANEELQFKFPYDGGSTATLMARSKEGSTDVLLMVSKGQFNNSINGQQIRVKFDEDKPATFSCSSSSDADPTVLFVKDTRKFLAKLKTSHKILVEAEFFDAGIKQMEFDTEGFVWDHK